MLNYSILTDKLDELRAAYRSTRDKRETDRIKVVVLLTAGWMAEYVAEALQVAPASVYPPTPRRARSACAASSQAQPRLFFNQSSSIFNRRILLLTP